MNPDSPIKIVSELLDLPLCDSEGKYCGIVDDVELDGDAGGKLKLDALLVGPGAYAGRLPRWATWLAKKIAGKRLTRVPMNKVRSIESAVLLECPARELGLHKSETAAGKWMPHWGAL
jgi:sporulation protein YlmC with PRC-barrel domain